MIANYVFMVGGAILIIIILRLEHKLRRMFQRRCEIDGCGCLRMHQTNYIEENCDVSSSSFRGRYVSTYIFSRCRKCGRLRYRSESRFISSWAWWWRKTFKPQDFKSPDDLFDEAGLSRPRQIIGLQVSRGNRSARLFRPVIDQLRK
ncbi:MAG: hypothetical protein WCG02_03375 [Candidatus Taylorbacteria bacterium]